MPILDNPARLRRLDPSGILASAKLFPDQLARGWRDAVSPKLPVAYSRALNLLVAGMGGSALGARIIDSLAFENLTLPLEIVSGYRLPAYVNRHSLVIISSYSGNTEESLACLREALDRHAMIIAVTAGGKLADLAAKHRLPFFRITPTFNPSGQPRMGLGYSLAAELTIMQRLGFISLEEAQLNESVNHLRSRLDTFSESRPTPANPLKQLVGVLSSRAVALVSAEHLTGAAHAFQNMLNENAKTLAVNFTLPELNHHLLEGLTYPASLKKHWLFLLIVSDSYAKVITTRFKITGGVLNKQGYQTVIWPVEGRTRLIQALDLVQTGGLVSTYLAFTRGTDPGPIPWVDYFKDRLAKS